MTDYELFSKYGQEYASQEGWDLFYSLKSADGEWQVQCLDEKGILPDDLAAWEIVRDGNLPHHRWVKSFLMQENPKEYQRIMNPNNN